MCHHLSVVGLEIAYRRSFHKAQPESVESYADSITTAFPKTRTSAAPPITYYVVKRRSVVALLSSKPRGCVTAKEPDSTCLSLKQRSANPSATLDFRTDQSNLLTSSTIVPMAETTGNASPVRRVFSTYN